MTGFPDALGIWLLVWLLTLGLNIVPTLMPPTWTLLAYFHIQHDMPVLPLALVGTSAAIVGRVLLAITARKFGERLMSEERKQQISPLTATLRAHRGFSLSFLLIVAIGPLPTSHLFIAVGLAGIPLFPVVLVFAVTRFASYLFWVIIADSAASSLSEVLSPSIGNAGAIVAQIVSLVLLVLLFRLNWGRILRRWIDEPPPST